MFYKFRIPIIVQILLLFDKKNVLSKYTNIVDAINRLPIQLPVIEQKPHFPHMFPKILIWKGKPAR